MSSTAGNYKMTQTNDSYKINTYQYNDVMVFIENVCQKNASFCPDPVVREIERFNSDIHLHHNVCNKGNPVIQM